MRIKMILLSIIIGMGIGLASCSTAHPRLEAGIKALKKNDYKNAYFHFLIYEKKFPSDVNGPLFLALTKLKEGNYDAAMAFYNKAAKINKDDPRVSTGVSLCSLGRFEKLLTDSSEMKGHERSQIETFYNNYLKAASNKDYRYIMKNSSILSILHGAGFLPQSEDDLMKCVNMYLGIITSATMKVYLQQFKIKDITIRNNTARIDLVSSDNKMTDSVYLKKEKSEWKMALFTRSLSLGEKI